MRIRIWDIWVRLFHWSLAISVIFLLISGKTGWEFYQWHRQAGELVLALLLFRWLWGLIGSSNARIKRLINGPGAVAEHVSYLARRRMEPERGHNAAGGWAVLAMLILLSVQAVTGLFIADEDEFIEGAFYGVLSSDTTDLLLYIHHLNSTFLLILVSVHVVAVFSYLIYARYNLIKPMISGFMHWPTDRPVPDVRWRPWWMGLALALGSLVTVGATLDW